MISDRHEFFASLNYLRDLCDKLSKQNPHFDGGSFRQATIRFEIMAEAETKEQARVLASAFFAIVSQEDEAIEIASRESVFDNKSTLAADIKPPPVPIGKEPSVIEIRPPTTDKTSSEPNIKNKPQDKDIPFWIRESYNGYTDLQRQLPDGFNQDQLIQAWQEFWRLDDEFVFDKRTTLDKYARTLGSIIEIVFMPRIAITRRLIILVDCSVEMWAFETTTDLLIDDYIKSSHLLYTSIYYYDQYPNKKCARYSDNLLQEALPQENYLYLDRQCCFPVSQREFQGQHMGDSVLIISDAGAASLLPETQRIAKTKEFLTELNNLNFNKCVWLNPVAKQRWKYTSARFIERFCRTKAIPMLDMEEFADNPRILFKILAGQSMNVAQDRKSIYLY